MATHKFNPNGQIIYRGLSQLDGTPIVAVVTGLATGSKNPKTGAMLQTWILVDEWEKPQAAADDGTDTAICGACPHRPANNGSCYVTLHHAPRAVWAALQRGSYATATDLAEIGADRKVRLGSYGDPAAVPAEVWESLTSRAIAWTGYTHQWRALRGSRRARLQRLVMASCDSVRERAMAKRAGWRTFRVRAAAEAQAEPGHREIVCPASAEAGHRSNCAKCRLCMGTASNALVDIVIAAHGARGKHFAN